MRCLYVLEAAERDSRAGLVLLSKGVSHVFCFRCLFLVITPDKFCVLPTESSEANARSDADLHRHGPDRQQTTMQQSIEGEGQHEARVT